MASQRVQFNEAELKQVLFSAALMSSVERDGQERDWETIQTFAEGYWQPEYGEYTRFQKRTLMEIRELLDDEMSLYETLDHLITEFRSSYNQEQKCIILGLLGYLFSANGIGKTEHSTLYAILLQRLGSDQPEIA